MKLLAVGTVAFDAIETPFGKTDKILGGAATYIGLAASSIVITAVYILRVVGKILFGKVQDPHHEELTDATWWERISVVTLIIAIVALGSLPLWISNMIHDSLMPVVNNLLR
jgi:NADH-quinone oxidoreductase subunit M